MATGGVVDKGLKKDALGFVSSVVIGVAAIAGTVILVGIHVLVAVAAISFAGPSADSGSLEAPPPVRPAETAGIA